MSRISNTMEDSSDDEVEFENLRLEQFEFDGNEPIELGLQPWASQTNLRVFSRTYPLFDYFRVCKELELLKTDPEIPELGRSKFLKTVTNMENMIFEINEKHKEVSNSEKDFFWDFAILMFLDEYILAYVTLIQLQIMSKPIPNSMHFQTGSALFQFLEQWEGTKFSERLENFRSEQLQTSQKEFEKEKTNLQNPTIQMKIAVIAHFVQLDDLLQKFGTSQGKVKDSPKDCLEDSQDGLFQGLPEERMFYSEKLVKNREKIILLLRELEYRGEFDRELIKVSLKKLASYSFSALCVQKYSLRAELGLNFVSDLSQNTLVGMCNWVFLVLVTMEKNPTVTEFELFDNGIKYFKNKFD